MADRRSALIRRVFTAVSRSRDLAVLLAATARLAREVESGSKLTGLTLSTWSRSRESVVLWVDLSSRPVSRMVEVVGPEGTTLCDLTVPDTAEGVSDD